MPGPHLVNERGQRRDVEPFDGADAEDGDGNGAKPPADQLVVRAGILVDVLGGKGYACS